MGLYFCYLGTLEEYHAYSGGAKENYRSTEVIIHVTICLSIVS